VNFRVPLTLCLAALTLSACASDIAAPRPAVSRDDPAAQSPWFEAGQAALAARKAQTRGNAGARNVILFIADGMDPTTVAAARIYDGQSRGEEGEENFLFFETFPHVAYAKTYTTDHQVPDSAGTASAMVTGVKTRSGVLSISADAPRGNCEASLNSVVPTIAELAEQAGLATGVVSTAEATHATPGAVYAHVADREWGSDATMPDAAKAAGCADIARQLIEFPHGDGIDVALGGGRAKFLPAAVQDPERPERAGERLDGRNLIEEWTAKSSAHRYVWNKEGFDAAPANSKLLGLFNGAHMQFEAARDRDPAGEPSLSEMTAKAIEILSRNENGFFLMVEGGRVDHAHHGGNAFRALLDTQAFAQAVRTAREMTDTDDTLIIVTADHGHTLAFQGYPAKGNPILGLVREPNGAGERVETLAADGKPYTTLAYANGPGSVFAEGADLSAGRPAPSQEAAQSPNHLQSAVIPTAYETHGGQDVGVYASGPKAHLISGVFEQNYIFHVMADALGL